MVLIEKVIKVNKDAITYPYSIDSFKNLDELDLNFDIVILVGDNGSGKSTMLEIIATKLNLYRISEDLNYNDSEFKELKKEANGFDINYLTKPKGFFFRSEDFITYIKFLEKTREEALREINLINEEYKYKSSYAKGMAKMPHMRTIGDIDNMYKRSLGKQSHGEAYLDFFKSRLRPNSLYLLDEAEMPLSINNQLALMLMIKEAIDLNCQFIIATHSPVLMSYPDACIYNVSEEGFIKTDYEEIETVQLLTDFLNSKEIYLRELFRN